MFEPPTIFEGKINKLAFVHIPKNGGQSIMKAFNGKAPRAGHVPLFKPLEGIQSVAIIREPVDRFESCYYYLCEGGCHPNDVRSCKMLKLKEFNNINEWFVEFFLFNTNTVFNQIHFMEQSRWFHKEAITYFLLFDYMNHNFKFIDTFLNGEQTIQEPIHKNKSNRSNYVPLKDGFVDILRKFYYKDNKVYNILLEKSKELMK